MPSQFDQDLDIIVKQCLISSSSSSTSGRILTEDDLQKGGIQNTSKTNEDETHVCEQIVTQSKSFTINVLPNVGADSLLANVLKGLHAIFDRDNNGSDGHDQDINVDEVRAIEFTRALHVVYGVLHTIVDQQQQTSSSSSNNLSNSSKELIGTFLISYCGYGKEDHDDSDEEEELDAVQQMKYNVISGHVRTIALECVTLLVQCGVCSNGNDVLLGIFNLQLAQHGMEHYLGISQFLHEQDISDSDYGTLVSNHMASLVRIQRTKCITLLQTALRQLTSTTTTTDDASTMVDSGDDEDDGAANTSTTNVTTTLSSSSSPTAASPLKTIRQFIVLCASLLHGETDPRCIKQILQLLHDCQFSFCVTTTTEKDNGQGASPIHRWLSSLCRQEQSSSSNEPLNYFPTVTVFDAIAPYYPIQFTPPSNDPYGISRNDLRHALNLVLCHPSLEVVGHDDPTSNTTTTMTCFACGLILEQLEVLPSNDNGEEDEIDDNDNDIMNGSSRRKDVQYMEALDDLRQLLLVRSSTTLQLLPSQMMTNVSDTLVDVFVKSMYSFVTKQHMNEKFDEDEDDDEDDNPSSDGSSRHNQTQQGTPLSRACLEFVVDLMSEFEVSTPQKLWDSFTSTTKLNNLLLSITSTPESINAKIGLVYICRGLCMKSHKARTKFIVETCIPPLLEKVIQYGQDRYQYRMSCGSTDSATPPTTNTTKKQHERIQASLLSLSACLTVLGNPIYTVDGLQSHSPKFSSTFINDMKELLIALLEICCLFNEDEENNHLDNVHPTTFLQPMAPFAINTLECFVLCFTTSTTAATQDEEHDENNTKNNDKIMDFCTLQTIFQQLTDICSRGGEEQEEGDDETNNNDLFCKWQMSCAHALGSFLGGQLLLLRSTNDENNNNDDMNDVESVPTNSNNKMELLGKTCLTKLVEWCCSATTTDHTTASCSALARACQVSSETIGHEDANGRTQATQSQQQQNVATMIVNQIWSSLMNNKSNHFECGLHGLAYVLEHGGISSKMAWRTCVTSTTNHDDNGVITNLLQQIIMSNSNNEQDSSIMGSTSTNTLITSCNICFEQLSGIEQVGSELVSCLLQLYNNNNNNDGAVQQQLLLILQCLSAFLSSGSPSTRTTTTSTNQSLMDVIPILIHLIRHSSCSDNNNDIKVLTSNCLFQILILINANLNNTNTTTMLDEPNKMTDTCSSTTTNMLLLENEFHIHAIVAAASFYKGGSSSMLGDEYLQWFLSLILWNGKEQETEQLLKPPPQCIIDSTTAIDWRNVFCATTTTNESLPLLASQAIGTILSCNGGGGDNDHGSPFRQQRIVFQLLPKLMTYLRNKQTTHKQRSSTILSEFSCYLVLSLVTCMTPLGILKEGGCFGSEVNDESSKQQQPPLIQCMTLLVKGLERFVPRLVYQNNKKDKILSEDYLVSFYTITVAAILKCIYGSTEDSTSSSSSTAFNNPSSTLAKDLIAIYLLLLTVGEEEKDESNNDNDAMNDETEDASGSTTSNSTTTTITTRMIPCTLLILETFLVLKTSSSLLSSRGATVLTTLVTNVCRRTVLDHPSHVVREAAVRVQNVWLSSSSS